MWGLLLFITVGVAAQSIEQEVAFKSILAQMFLFAKAHKKQALVELAKKSNGEQDTTLSLAYSVALYLADKKRERDRFVQNFPTDGESITLLYELGVSDTNLMPSFLFPFESLGEIAASGHRKAIKKLSNVIIHSDGVVTSTLCEYAGKLFLLNLETFSASISGFDQEDRQKVYSCFESLSEEDQGKVRLHAKKLSKSSGGSPKKALIEISNFKLP